MASKPLNPNTHLPAGDICREAPTEYTEIENPRRVAMMEGQRLPPTSKKGNMWVLDKPTKRGVR